MSNCNCYCNTSCAGLSIVASIILGIIAGMLRFIGVINVTAAFLWVVFGIAIVYLGLTLIASYCGCGNAPNKCVCQTVPVYLVGILGTILTSLVLLGVSFGATSVIASIITGFLLGFFTLTITSAVCIIKCKTICSNS